MVNSYSQKVCGKQSITNDIGRAHFVRCTATGATQVI